MSLDIFTSQQSFQKNLIDSNQGFESKRDYTTSLKKNEFKTSRSQRNDLKQSEQKENFAKMMSSLKKKEAETNNKSENKQITNEKQINDLRNRASISEINKGLFQTQENDVAIVINATNPTENISENTIDIASITALNAEIQKLIDAQEQNSDEINKIVITSETKPEEIDGLLTLIYSFLEKPDDITNAPDHDQLSNIIEKLESIMNSDDGGLITLSLSPEQLTRLQEIIQKHINDEIEKHDSQALEALAASFVILEPPTKQARKDASQTNIQIIPEQANQPIKSEHHSQSRYDAKYDMRYDAEAKSNIPANDTSSEKVDFKSTLKNADMHAKPAHNDNNISSAQKLLQSTGLLAQNTVSAADISTGQNLNISAVNGQTLLQSSATNVITQSQSASSAHPATQMVSATIQKAVKAGEDTTIKLRLDPPELGRVEVKMSIDKDNATKIVLTAEKPETYMLLKQDTEILQNALNNSGLDSSEGSIDFELASESHDFNQNNKQSSKQNNSNTTEEELIETTMDWQVDPNTGRMHYNVLV